VAWRVSKDRAPATQRALAEIGVETGKGIILPTAKRLLFLDFPAAQRK